MLAPPVVDLPTDLEDLGIDTDNEEGLEDDEKEDLYKDSLDRPSLMPSSSIKQD